jgi:hypothetical protein
MNFHDCIKVDTRALHLYSCTTLNDSSAPRPVKGDGQMGDEQRYLIDEKEAARRLGVSVRFLQARRLMGGGPFYVKVGRSVRYRPLDLEVWTASQTYESTAQY